MNYLGLLPSSGGGGGGLTTHPSATTTTTTGTPGQVAAAAAAERIDRGATWSDPEVDELLNIWTNENVQAELKEATIKKHIFERIARSLREKGFYRTAEQCREKIKRLKKEYRQAKNNNYRCVRGRATVKFFPRLQAVLDGRPCPKTGYYEHGTTVKFEATGEIQGGGGEVTTGSGPFGLNLKSSPHSYSECSAEEIKVEVNPAEVDNDAYMDSGQEGGDHRMDERGGHNHSLPTAHHQHHIPIGLSKSLSLTIPAYHTRHLPHPNHHHHHHPNIHPQYQRHHSRSLLHNGLVASTPGVVNLCTADDDQEICSMGEEGSSSRGGSCTPGALTPTQNSPSNSPARHLDRNKKKVKRIRGAISAHALKETLDLALDRFLKYQRGSEERLFAWEERRIQMELEAEERWRQEDREMLRQIFTHLQVPVNSEPSPSSSGSHSNDR